MKKLLTPEIIPIQLMTSNPEPIPFKEMVKILHNIDIPFIPLNNNKTLVMVGINDLYLIKQKTGLNILNQMGTEITNQDIKDLTFEHVNIDSI